MNIVMAPLEIIGLKRDLPDVVHALRTLGCVQIDRIQEAPQVSARPLNPDPQTLQTQEELTFLVARLEGLLDIFGGPVEVRPPVASEDCLAAARTGIDTLIPLVQSLSARRERLETEAGSLPRYESTLRKLLPIIPVAARDPANVTVGVLVNRSHIAILDAIGKQALEQTAGRAEVVSGDVDSVTRAMLIVFPSVFTGEIESILGHKDVSRLRLPTELGAGPPDQVLATLHSRMAEIPGEIKSIDRELAGLALEWREKITVWRDCLQDRLEAGHVLSRFGETDLTFVIVGWTPKDDLDRVRQALAHAAGESILVSVRPMTDELKEQAPVSLRNPAPAQPFESLVNLLALPRYGHTDPTRLMALFLPIFFGMILGDVGYGILLLLISLGALRRFKKGVARDILIVLAMGSGWAIVFGFLFGEAFGTLGEYFGMHAIWFERADTAYVAALLLLTIGVGAAHITLGLIIGVWEAAREKSRSHLLERGGMLIGLISLFLLVGALAGRLPEALRTPAWAGIVIGVVLISASLGWLGILMGPIEFIGLIGNVLSYLRIAAIGLASVYLAKVANDVAGSLGSLVVGVIVAVLIHALNLILGAFSPTIHSLRLHYVEFFRKFYEGGGRPYEPFRSRLS